MGDKYITNTSQIYDKNSIRNSFILFCSHLRFFRILLLFRINRSHYHDSNQIYTFFIKTCNFVVEAEIKVARLIYIKFQNFTVFVCFFSLQFILLL